MSLPKPEPICFLHGWGFDHHIWRAFIETGFSDCQNITPDIPVYTQALEQQQSLASSANLLGDSLPEKVNVVGWSLGGQLAIELAKKHPDKVKKIVLLNCNPCFIKKNDWTYGIEASEIIRMRKALFKNKQKVMQQFYRLVTKGALNEKKIFTQIINNKNSYAIQGLANGLTLLLEEDQRRALANLTQPVLMVFSEKDNLVNFQVKTDCLALNPSIVTQQIYNSGHIPFLSDVDATAKIVRSFFIGEDRV